MPLLHLVAYGAGSEDAASGRWEQATWPHSLVCRISHTISAVRNAGSAAGLASGGGLRRQTIAAPGVFLLAHIVCPLARGAPASWREWLADALPEVQLVLLAAGLDEGALSECRLFVHAGAIGHSAAVCENVDTDRTGTHGEQSRWHEGGHDEGGSADAWWRGGGALAAAAHVSGAEWFRPSVVPALALSDARGPLAWALRLLCVV